jgi:putative ABC transport system permease protein
MRQLTLVRRSLAYYWRTNLAVVLGVGIAVAVLAGALLVGASVRASLRDLALSRLGKTDSVISAEHFFRENVAADMARGKSISTCPLIEFQGLVTHETSGRRSSGVVVYGVDERFWRFHGVTPPELPAMSTALAAEVGSKPGDSILIRVQKQAVIPLESLHGRKEDVGRTMRFIAHEALAASALGEFSLRPRQSAVRAIFVPLGKLARELGQTGRVNTILISGETAARPIEQLLRDRYSLDDTGVRLRILEPQQRISLESSSAIIIDRLAGTALEIAGKLGLHVEPIYSYLANAIRSGAREIPYSVVAADDDFFMNRPSVTGNLPPILLNDWAAKDLGIQPGAPVSLDYYVWLDDGQLHSESARFQLAGILPISGAAADRNLTPDYPGISESESLRDWDPPFPIDLKRVRPHDDDYWKKYRATPKAFIPLAVGQRLWGTRFGKLTSIRISSKPGENLASTRDAFGAQLRSALDPLSMGFSISAARAQALTASQGATDFGEYFVYFSFFLVTAALLLAALFFRLGIEQRLREIGMFRAVGLPHAIIRSVFFIEGSLLALAGSVAGVAGALAYGALVMFGLRTRWLDAVGTTSLSLHIAPVALVIGGAAGFLSALGSIAWTLRGLRSMAPRALLASVEAKRKIPAWSGLASGVAGVLLLGAAVLGVISQVAGFFGAGTLLLTAALFETRQAFSRRRHTDLDRISKLGFRNAAWRPGRSVLCIALIASATFLIIAVDAFRRDTLSALDPKSGTGGYPLMAESLLSVIHDPNSASGREALNLNKPAFGNVHFTVFRARAGDDASCLNLYQPRDPRILAPAGNFIQQGRFSFQDSLAKTTEQKGNPWLLLDSAFSDGAIPAMGDANSITYVLHRKLGEDVVINSTAGGHPVRLRLVAALADSIFQGELLISEQNFLRLFPNQPGYRFFLLDVPRENAADIPGALEAALTDYGFDVTSTAEHLAAFHRVENTYISTFQMLGALGLLLGTFGLAAVLVRNVLERRREMALLQAVGYRRRNLGLVILAENALLLVGGLAIGAVCALIAVIPAIVSRGGHLAALSMAGWLAIILITGLAAAGLATLAMIRLPLVPALRAE